MRFVLICCSQFLPYSSYNPEQHAFLNQCFPDLMPAHRGNTCMQVEDGIHKRITPTYTHLITFVWLHQELGGKDITAIFLLRVEHWSTQKRPRWWSISSKSCCCKSQDLKVYNPLALRHMKQKAKTWFHSYSCPNLYTCNSCWWQQIQFPWDLQIPITRFWVFTFHIHLQI